MATATTGPTTKPSTAPPTKGHAATTDQTSSLPTSDGSTSPTTTPPNFKGWSQTTCSLDWGWMSTFDTDLTGCHTRGDSELLNVTVMHGHVYEPVFFSGTSIVTKQGPITSQCLWTTICFYWVRSHLCLLHFNSLCFSVVVCRLWGTIVLRQILVAWNLHWLLHKGFHKCNFYKWVESTKSTKICVLWKFGVIHYAFSFPTMLCAGWL